jgi:hypothetical protein
MTLAIDEFIRRFLGSAWSSTPVDWSFPVGRCSAGSIEVASAIHVGTEA